MQLRRRLLAAALVVVMLVTALPVLAVDVGDAIAFEDALNGSDTTITLTGDIELQNTGVLTLKDGFTLTAEQPATLTVGDGVHLQVSSMAQVNPNATILSGGSGNVVLVKNGGSAYQ